MSQKIQVPDNLEEEYYQINPDILGSFPKYRPPLNFFRFREDISRLAPFYKVGERLSNEQVEQLAELVSQGYIFVSRADHAVYVKHISYQLDLVLVDKNLREQEIADIFIEALTMRLDAFFEQPVKPALEKLTTDIMVLTEYLWADPYRIRALTKRLHAEHTLAKHSLNCGVMGMALFIKINADAISRQELKRRTFDRTALGFFLHDLGMVKIPAFIRDKTKPLTSDERGKILQHPYVGNEMLARLDSKFPETEQCVLQHHERMNGTGYPQKLKDRDFSLLGRMCAVVDSYCAMVAKRPYAEAMEPAKAIGQLCTDEKHYDVRLSRLLQSLVMTGK